MCDGIVLCLDYYIQGDKLHTDWPILRKYFWMKMYFAKTNIVCYYYFPTLIEHNTVVCDFYAKTTENIH